jgi:hypothetical protein
MSEEISAKAMEQIKIDRLLKNEITVAKDKLVVASKGKIRTYSQFLRFLLEASATKLKKDFSIDIYEKVDPF